MPLLRRNADLCLQMLILQNRNEPTLLRMSSPKLTLSLRGTSLRCQMRGRYSWKERGCQTRFVPISSSTWRVGPPNLQGHNSRSVSQQVINHLIPSGLRHLTLSDKCHSIRKGLPHPLSHAEEGSSKCCVIFICQKVVDLNRGGASPPHADTVPPLRANGQCQQRPESKRRPPLAARTSLPANLPALAAESVNP